MLRILSLILLSSFFVKAEASERVYINGKPIVCNKEAYNCPSYRGKYKWKRLKTCEDVQVVWTTCKGDIHDLDRDKDGKPCENDCPNLLFKGKK